jgi:hypothetical protein
VNQAEPGGGKNHLGGAAAKNLHSSMNGNQHYFLARPWRLRQRIEIFTLTVSNNVRHLTNKNAPEMIPARFQIVMWITFRRKGPGCGW